LPRTVSEFLGDEPSTVSFEEFLKESGNALTPKDKKKIDIDDPAMILLTISRISKWLEEVVLPGQNILVDAPHLVHRYPSLLKGNHKDLETWNNTALLNLPDKELGLNFENIEQFKIKNDHWLSRPAWFLNQLIEYQEIKEVKEPWSREPTNFVFCEDSSTFNKKDQCKEFLIEIDTPYARRYVCEFKGVNYVPRVRFAL
jgi:hypothetical protein